MVGSILGTEVRRVEDRDLLIGASTFVDNLRLDGTLHAVFVRSPYAHARITAVDTTEAAAAPGVVRVLLAEDLPDAPLPEFAITLPDCSRRALAGDKVRFVGDPVALVIARTRAQAVDAAELVDVDYDPLPAVVDLEEALRPGAPLQFEELGSNIAGTVGDPDPEAGDPLAGATHVTRLRMVNQRLAAAPLEGNAIVVRANRAYDSADPTTSDPMTSDPALSVWLSTQHPHGARNQFAKYLGLDAEQVHVVVPHVGGAFGGKAGARAEHLTIAAAARLVDGPLAWTETRSEAMLSMHGRGQVQCAELGLDPDGRITGLRVRVLADCGAYAGFGGSLAFGPTRMMIQGPYEIPKVSYSAVAVLTNTAPMGAFRGAGRPEATALLERLLDAAAAEVGLAPEELRRRNLIPADAFPYRTRVGTTYDNGDYRVPLEAALKAAGIDDLRAEQQRRRETGAECQLGIGVASYVEITGFGGSEFGSVHVHPDGSATVRSGTSAHGQGHATSFSMIVADRLGIPLERLTYEQSDTFTVRTGGGTGGSRSLQLGGNAVAQAADEVLEKARALAAKLLEADPADVEVVDDGFAVAGVPGTAVSWPELAAHAQEVGADLDSDTDFTQEGATFPFGAHVAVVEVDTETGKVTPLRLVAVDDCGTILNPMIVRGQQHGGSVQGISQALWEEMVYDDEGTPLTSTFVDYALPTAADTFEMETSNTETPTPANPLGAKGIGESGTIGSTPAVQNAVIDAVRHLGVTHVDLPCSARRVWSALQGTGPAPWREPDPAWWAGAGSAPTEAGPEAI